MMKCDYEWVLSLYDAWTNADKEYRAQLLKTSQIKYTANQRYNEFVKEFKKLSTEQIEQFGKDKGYFE